jgi:hypothetical protein
MQRVVQRDEATEAVAQQEQGNRGMLGSNPDDEATQVFPELAPGSEVGSLPRRPSVSPEIRCEDLEAQREKCLGYHRIET